MKTEEEIRAEIKQTTENYLHVLERGRATIDINAPVSLMQLGAITALNRLYWVLGEKRPQFAYDTEKVNT
jgi:hypothetical protein